MQLVIKVHEHYPKCHRFSVPFVTRKVCLSISPSRRFMLPVCCVCLNIASGLQIMTSDYVFLHQLNTATFFTGFIQYFC